MGDGVTEALGVLEFDGVAPTDLLGAMGGGLAGDTCGCWGDEPGYDTATCATAVSTGYCTLPSASYELVMVSFCGLV